MMPVAYKWQSINTPPPTNWVAVGIFGGAGGGGGGGGWGQVPGASNCLFIHPVSTVGAPKCWGHLQTPSQPQPNIGQLGVGQKNGCLAQGQGGQHCCCCCHPGGALVLPIARGAPKWPNTSCHSAPNALGHYWQGVVRQWAAKWGVAVICSGSWALLLLARVAKLGGAGQPSSKGMGVCHGVVAWVVVLHLASQWGHPCQPMACCSN